MNDDYLGRAAAEVQAGRLWRAKEILEGNLPTRGYDLALYEAYGALLAEMGDDLEAGRFLFLSGARKPEYDEPVQLYLQRFGLHGWQQLVGTFPAAAKRPSLAEYPGSVAAALRRLGRPEFVALHEMRRLPPHRRPSLAKTIGCAVLVTIVIFGLLAIL